MDKLMKATAVKVNLELAPFTRSENKNGRRLYVPCIHVTYVGEGEIRSFAVGGTYDLERDAYEAAISCIAAFYRLCDINQADKALPELVRLALAERILPESATPKATTRAL